MKRFSQVFSVLLVLAVAESAFCQLSVPKPGPEHKILASKEGVWDAVVKGGPGMADSKGLMTIKSTCGGLWITSEFVGEFAGMKFEGRGLDGYDPEKKKYVGVWVDSMSAAPLNLEGTFDEKTKVLTWLGTGPGPDGKPAKYKMTTSDTKDDKFTFTMALVGADGKDMEMAKIEYSKKK